MNEFKLFVETMHLAKATVGALVAIGCIHDYMDKAGPVTVEVPPEEAHYDVSNGLMWVAVNPQRLPRSYTTQSLIENGFKDAVTSRFGSPVEIQLYGQMLVVMSRLNLPEEQEGGKPQELPLAV